MDIIVHPAVILVIAIVLIILLSAAFLLGRHLPRRRYPQDELSAVTRQHIDLFQGGQLNETAVESAKARFRILLERGEVEAVEASLRPGTHYVEQVRALAEIGTDDAGRILERQLQRRLTEDQIEQSWYWIDLANSLRSLNREQSLPQLLRCAEQAGEMPLSHFLAAETACFLGFAGYLRHPESSLGRAALRVLHRALEGLRLGVPPQVVAEGRLGEAVENLWDNRPEQVDPLAVRVFAEALRQLRRAPNADVAFTDEVSEKEAYHWQMSRLAALEEVFKEYLHEAAGRLASALAGADPAEQREILQALADLRADVSAAVLPLFDRPDFPHAELAVEVLAWSRDPKVANWLRTWVIQNVPVIQRAQRRRKALPGRHRSLPHGFPYQAVLRALRGHPSRETEMFLLLAARDWDPTYRAAALSSFGWWEPWHRPEVLMFLQEARRDPNPEVRQAARTALARLGERQALQTFRQALTCEESQRIHEAIQVVSSEGITLLWPDLDRLADAEDADIAHHAREALEVLCEEMDNRPG
jgi:HEAT repeat protein